MNKKELEILKIEEDFRDTLENESAKNQKENVKIKILDIKFIGKVSWKDKINGKGLEEPLFEVEKEIEERGCIGSISEMYDSKKPQEPKGAISQAWSVAEIIRILNGNR